MASDLLQRKRTHFLLWRSRHTAPAPQLIIGRFRPGNPPDFVEQRRFDLHASATERPDLWEIAASACQLADGEVYHYWFEVTDSNPDKSQHPRILCTDPTAWTTDWRLLGPRLAPPFGEDDRDPPGVIRFQDNALTPCDPGGETADWQGDPAPAALPPNHRLVIYELPTAWSRLEELEAEVQLGVGTFRDVLALIDADSEPPNFAGVAALEKGRAHLKFLGVNALELLPPADSFVDREWGYATSNYFAADYDLGFPKRHASPTATSDLAHLVKRCHQHRIRFFADMVMAFATRYSYQNINFLDFHVQAGTDDPEAVGRDSFGGDLFKYNYWVHTYDPISGETRHLVPARQLMLTQLTRWMQDFRIDGVRIDSIKSIGNWDFVQEFKDHARRLWHARWSAQTSGADERFLVVGEELAVPMGLIEQQRVDGLWNEHFKRLVRHAILGKNDEHEPSFEWTVRKLVDCRLLGFRDGAQAVNYVTSHDVEGFRNERLFEFLKNNRVSVNEAARRIKLAFVCLLTAVGIPMIFAGEEFADEHDLPVRHPPKQVDPVNFDRVAEPWRDEIFRYVARLVRLRTTHDALAVNDTRFIHADFDEGKRVIVWQRGQEASDKLAVVVANFSDFATPHPFSPGAEYVVPNWPALPSGKHWREITQERNVSAEWAGREPIFPWEAKVYVTVD